MMNKELFLCFVKFIGKDIEENNIYELLFTNDKESFFGEDFEYKPCCIINNMSPFENSYQLVKQIKTKIDLELIQNSCCCSFSDCQDGILPVAFENIDPYTEYPEHRLILHYGITYDETINELAKSNIVFDEKSEE